MNEDNTNEGYYLFWINPEKMLVFVTRKQIVFPEKLDKKAPLDEIVKYFDRKNDEWEFSLYVHEHPGFRLSNCEVVDITDWNYDNYPQLRMMVDNYEPESISRQNPQ